MTTATRSHQVDLDNGPLGGRRRSYTPCCTCGWVASQSFTNQIAAAAAAVAHQREGTDA